MRSFILSLVTLVVASDLVWAQASGNRALNVVPNPSSTSDTTAVPVVVKFSGNLRALDQSILSGPKGLTFAIYRDQTGGSPLWLETQSVLLDAQGRFNAF